jgi:DNA-directed RNA polymerase III subunit RPC11
MDGWIDRWMDASNTYLMVVENGKKEVEQLCVWRIELVFSIPTHSLNMMHFCPTCANVLLVRTDRSPFEFYCQTCPYIHPIQTRIGDRTVFERKAVDDVLGGAKAWENVDSTEERCPKCDHNRAYYMQIQTRSADEPMTTFYKCCNRECNYQWREK